MDLFLKIVSIYLLGGILGFIAEVFFRRFVSLKRWIKPGFLYGPFIPLYGFGFVIFFLVREFLFFDVGVQWVNYLINILILGFLLTLIEYIAGLIFIKGLGIKLWDYSNRKFNLQGIICPEFSLIWLGASAIYSIFLHPYLSIYGDWFISAGTASALILGVFIGVHFMDFAFSVKLATKIRLYFKEAKVTPHWEKLKVLLIEKGKELKKKAPLVNPFSNIQRIDFKEAIETYKAKVSHDLEELNAKKEARRAKRLEKRKPQDEDNK